MKGRGISRCLAKSGHNIILTYNSNVDAANENKAFIEENFSDRVQKVIQYIQVFPKHRLFEDKTNVRVGFHVRKAPEKLWTLFSVKCAIVKADFIDANKESVAAIFDVIKQNSEFQKSFVGFVHNAGGYRHPPGERPSIEFAQACFQFVDFWLDIMLIEIGKSFTKIGMWIHFFYLLKSLSSYGKLLKLLNALL